MRALLFAGDVPALCAVRAINARSTRGGAARRRMKIFSAPEKAGAKAGGKALSAPGRRTRHAINAPDQWG
ncbi:hypothetical protein [Variovorax sp. V213]|uniref:hypothetical protein n=1 Tax=Variovorax sp. V213 TaxID=3065955 RepID=UPI0034E8CA1E